MRSYIVGGGKFSEEVAAYSGFEIVDYKSVLSIDNRYVIAIGNPKYKERIVNLNPDIKWLNYKDYYARLYTTLKGNGILILPGTVITTNVKIGSHVSINLNCTVGHDSIIGDYTTIHPGCNISGNVQIGNMCEIGTNSCIIPGVKVGNNVIVGAGSVIIKDVQDDCIVVGNPAKVVKRFIEGKWVKV